MVITLCQCDGLPPHEHRFTGRTVPGSLIEAGPFKGQRYERMEVDPYDIRVSVDWKAVAKALGKESRA